jgi:branched-chain amino acid transport system substrate-binding protein
MTIRNQSRRTGTKLGTLSVLAAFGLALAFVTDSQNSTASADDTITIGAVKALSGGMSSFDVPPLNGAKLAIADINAAGGVLGKQLDVVVVDFHTKVEESGPGAREALDQGAELIITSCDFDFGAPAALVAQAANVAAFSDCAGSVQFGVQGIGPLAFTMGNMGRSEGAIMAEWGYQKKNWTKAWVLQDSVLLYYDEVCTGFKDRFLELGGTIVGHETFKPTDPTVATQISKLGSGDRPDILFVCAWPTAGAAAFKQLRAAGYNEPILSSNTYDGAFWIGAIPDISDLYFANYASMWGDDPSAEVNAFFERYAAAYGGLPENSNVVTGYAVIQAFALGAEAAGSTDGDQVAEALNNAGAMDLLVGPTTYTADLHADLMRPQRIMEVQNGKPSYLEMWTLSSPPKVEF